MSRKTNHFALRLSALAGFVDAVGFLKLGGMFVSFMSGNSTKMAVALAQGNFLHAAHLAGIVALFVTGAMLGTVTAKKTAPTAQTAAVLALVTALLAAAALAHAVGGRLTAIALMALAMGVENASLQRDDDTTVPVTYMTGTLVKMGQRLGLALLGGDRRSWAPYFLMWLGLISGGAAGALLYHYTGLHSLWLASAWAAWLTLSAQRG